MIESITEKGKEIVNKVLTIKKEKSIVTNDFIKLSEKPNESFKSGVSYSFEIDKGLLIATGSLFLGAIAFITAINNKSDNENGD